MGLEAVEITGFDYNPDSGCITAVKHSKGEIPIESWGCEFGNWYGFFSQAKTGGTNVDVIEKAVEGSEREIKSRFEVALPRGRYLFKGSETLVKGRIKRKYIIRALERSTLGDFVIRAGLCSRRWVRGYLGGRELRHRRSNTMVQLPESTACVRNDQWQIKFVMGETSSPKPLDVLTYLRDEPTGLWIIHHRLLAKDSDCEEYVLRFRNKIWSSREHKSVGWKLSRKLLWRCAERRLKRLPTLQIGGNILLASGEEVKMNSSVSLERFGCLEQIKI